MTQKKIKIDRELSILIERLHYEVASRQDVLSFMITHNMDITGDAFKKYQEEYREVYVEYNTAKAELEKTYIFPIIENKKCNWTLNFDEEEIILDIVEE